MAADGAVVHQLEWRAMGTSCHVLVHGRADAAAATAAVRSIVAQLELRWSRFLGDSEISRINGAGGATVEVSPETFLAVHEAVAARGWSGGRFDPTVLPALRHAGYDRDFDAVAVRADLGQIDLGGPVPAGARVDLDADAFTVTVEPGAALDLGGIGKGLAADLAATAALLVDGVGGVCVNLGGDLRAAGRAPTEAGWGVAIDDPRDGSTLATIAFADGGLATSSTRRRRWSAGGRDQHHVIDPVSGAPAGDALWSATVLASTAKDAEVLATAALVAGCDEARALLEHHGAPALLVSATDVITVGSIAEYLR